MISELANNVALATAERVRKNLGPRAALVPYRALAENAADSETRGRAVLEAVSCAAELSDEALASTLVGLYTSVTKGALDVRARTVVLALCARGYWLVAAGLAALELLRNPRAVTAYLHGRCLERARDSGARAAFVEAERLAEREGDAVVLAQARAFRAAILYESGRVDDARVLEKSLVLRELPEALVLRLAPFGLGAPSRFVRAGWLTELERIVRDGDDKARALRVVCEHAERMSHSLSEIERDRVLAVFAKLTDERLGAALRARLEAWKSLTTAALASSHDEVFAVLRALADAPSVASARRAIDLATGRFEAKVELPRGSAEGLAFAAAGAVRDGDTKRAEVAFSALVALVPQTPPLVRVPCWEAAYLGLFVDDDGVRAAALGVARALVASSGSPPLRGALAVARAARAAGDEELSESLLAVAVAAREAGASATYVEVARELAWKAAIEGRRDDARRLLREATLASR